MTIMMNYRYISATSTPATNSPTSQDPSTTPTTLTPPTKIVLPKKKTPTTLTPPTKIILPKKKPQKWSTGVAPGDYGGPPTTTKLRKYWGGEGEDPLTSDDYIWNRDFMGRMKKLIEDPSELPSSAPVKEEPSGFLSLSRVMSLDSLEVDLSKELMSPSKPVVEQPVEAAQASGSMLRKWKPAPTRREQEKWNRATKAATGGSDVMFREIKRPRGDPKVLAAQSREQYFKLKKKLQIITLGVGGIGLLSAYVSYSPEIAARGAIAQPRILVPVVLVMIYNRWNGILVPDYGFMQLQLIPMLVGFFTYKIATFIQAIEEALPVVEEKTRV